MKRFITFLIFGALLLLPSAAKAEKFERNISLTDGPVFMPKGEFIFGGTFSYNNFNFDD